jgi:hypothetical protein
VANEIYTTTRDGLAGLVSRQVAESVLRRAVTGAGLDPDAVDAEAMSRLLRGRVRRTLERTLPRAGVRRHLADLDARIARLDAPRPAAPTSTRASPVPIDAPAPPTPAAPAAAPAPAPDRTDPERASAAPIAPAPPAAPAPPVARAAPARVPSAPVADAPPLPPDAVLERLGRLDAVRQWTWAPDRGRPVARGAGPEAERAQRLLAPIVTVLGRSGAVRSVHVQHGRGHVLVGRTAGATFAVATDLDVNLGAIYAAFRALKEEP